MVRLGLFLIGVVVWSTEQIWQSSQGRRHYVRAGAARLALAGVSLVGALVDGIGALVDRLSGLSAAPETSRRRAVGTTSPRAIGREASTPSSAML